MTETFPIKGVVTYWLYDDKGNLKETKEIPNLIVNTGKNFVANAMAATTSITFNYIGIGTDATTPNTTDTALIAQVARQVSATTTVTPAAGATPPTVAYTTTFLAGVATGTLQEVGMFSAISGGTMFARTLIGGVFKDVGDILTINWTFTLG